MVKKYKSVLIGGGLLAAAIVLGFAAQAVHAQAQANAVTALNQDLIQSQASLEGWQMDAARGSLASADYRVAFSSDLSQMQTQFQSDAMALGK